MPNTMDPGTEVVTEFGTDAEAAQATARQSQLASQVMADTGAGSVDAVAENATGEPDPNQPGPGQDPNQPPTQPGQPDADPGTDPDADPDADPTAPDVPGEGNA